MNGEDEGGKGSAGAMTSGVTNVLVAVLIVALLLLSLEFGFRVGGKVVKRRNLSASQQVGVIQGGTLGLLGLLLAFSFAAAGARFIERQDLIIREANAIGTAFLRADLLDEPHRTELRTALKDYTRYRLEAVPRLRSAVEPEFERAIREQHARIWTHSLAGVSARPGSTLVLIPAINEVLDVHATRVAASFKHIPLVVLVLLGASSCLITGTIGYGCALERTRRPVLTMSFALLVAASLWITIDLDYARGGLLHLSDAPLKSLNFD